MLRRAQWKYPADYWINFKLGLVLIYPGKEHVEEGMGYMRAALAIRPQNSHPLLILGIGYGRLKRYDDAIACYRKAIELSPNYGHAYGNLASALNKNGLHADALAYYRKCLELSPQDGSSHNRLAFFLATSPDAKLRDPDEAVKLARRAIELHKNEHPLGAYLNTLGTAQYRAGDWRGAIESLKKAENLQSGRYTSCNAFFLAMAYWQLGEQDEARCWFGQAVEWIEKQQNQNDDEELRQFRAEAMELLKITDENQATNSPVEVK